jgi:(p)ppGpp synthase/HD superfamily hydrolase
MNNQKIELAKKYCLHYHEGQFRKGNNLPYHTHPFAVAKILARYGYDDPVTQCIALLHDTVEDSKLRMDEVQETFGYEISNGVYILSRNKGKMEDGQKLSHEDYIQRLSWARNKIKRVKIADVIHNTQDLESLTLEGIEEKISDAEKFYIPWGREIAPIMAEELVSNIANYHRKWKK